MSRARGSRTAGARAPWRGPAILLALGVAVFANTLGNGLVMDDHFIIDRNPYPADASSVALAFRTDVHTAIAQPRVNPGYYRPLAMASFFLERALWGTAPMPFHLTNVLLHLANVLLAYAVFVRLLGSRGAALGASALWCVHPIASECVAWIAGRTDLIATLGILGCAVCYLRYRDTHRARWLAVAAVCAYVGCLGKEIGVLAPVVALVCGMAADLPRAPSRVRIRSAVVLVGPVAVYLIQRAVVLGPYAHKSLPGDALQYLRMLSASIGYYARCLVWPVALVGDLHMKEPTAVDGRVIAGAMVILVWAAAAAFSIARRRPRVLALLLLIAISLMPTSGIAGPPHVAVATRFLYVPALWIIAVLVLAGGVFAKGARWATVATCAIVVLLAVVTVKRNREYANDRTFYEAVVDHATRAGWGVEPGYFVLENYGHMLADDGRLADAERYTRWAIDVDPTGVPAINNLGNIAIMRGDTASAVTIWRKLAASDTTVIDAVFNIGLVMDHMGRYEDAIAAYEEALRRGMREPRRSQVVKRLEEIQARRSSRSTAIGAGEP